MRRLLHISALALTCASSPALAQGVPVIDGASLGEEIAKLAAMAKDFTEQANKLGQRRTLDEIEKEQLEVLKGITEAISGPAYDLESLEAAGGGVDTVYPVDPNSPVDKRLFGDTRETLEMMIAQVAAEFAPRAAVIGLSPTQFRCLFQALIKQESRFNVTISSPVGAYGLTQLMPGTASDLGVDRYDPIQNLRGGADYITQQMKRFGNIAHALAAYNAGPGNVIKYGGIPPFKETQGYVRNITKFYNEYLARVGGVDALGTLSPGDWAMAEWSNTSDALSQFGATNFATVEQVAARLSMIIKRIDGTKDAKEAWELNTYARAEIGRIVAMRMRLLAAKQVQHSAEGLARMADRLAEYEFKKMGVPN